MQIFWVSSSVGEIKSVNLTKKTLAMWLIACTMALISFGIIVEYVRARLALRIDFSLTAEPVNLHRTTKVESLQNEIANLNKLYHARLSEARKQADAAQQAMKERLIQIQKQADISFQKVKELEIANRQLTAIATPPALLNDKQKNTGLGGPFRPEPNMPLSAELPAALDTTLEELTQRNNFIIESATRWNQQIAWLTHKPITIPVNNNVYVSSPFGARIDPITNSLSRHTGLDFQAATGTPIFASGAGVVEKAGWDPEYGNEVLINHGDGFMTRYAHASQLLVKTGETVAYQQLIAKSGSTGRTTGPHLHFEVLKDSKAMDPSKVLIGLGR